MITNATPATEPATDMATTAVDWLVGDYYDRTAESSIDQVADSVYRDLCDVRDDGLFPATAVFELSPDSDGPVPVLRVTISGLIDTTAPGENGVSSVVYESMRIVFGLANHYNRVHLTRPNRARFIQHITALRPDSAPAIVLIGMMHDSITTAPPAHPTNTTSVTRPDPVA